MKSSVYKAFIKKDLKTVFGDKIIFLPMIIIPVIFCLLLPVGLLIGINFIPEKMSDSDFDKLPLPPEIMLLGEKEKILYTSLNILFPSLFLLIPVLTASIIAGTGFVGEKENKTIESILYSPVSISEIFNAKILSAFIPSFLITVFSFLMFLFVMLIGINLSGINLPFPVLKWSLLTLWVSPSVSLLSIFVMVIISASAKTYQQAQQRIIFIILPLLFLIIGQLSGIFILNSLLLFIIGLLIFITDFFLLKLSVKNFIPEKLIT